MPSYLGSASGKLQGETGWRGDIAAEKLPGWLGAGVGDVGDGSDGGKPSWHRAAPVWHKAALGTVAAEAGVGLAGLQTSDGWTQANLLEPQV